MPVTHPVAWAAAAVALFVALPAAAVPAAWRIQGTLHAAEGSNLHSSIQAWPNTPALPPAGLTSLRFAVFEICFSNADVDCGRGCVAGQITQVAPVSEPQTWLMLGAGLLALGLRGRR